MRWPLQHTATHCTTRQHTATPCNTLQHTATHCNTLQHTATHCNTLHLDRTMNNQRGRRYTCMSLQHTATHCNTLQHTATHCNTLQHTATHGNTLHHTATHSDTLHPDRAQQPKWQRLHINVYKCHIFYLKFFTPKSIKSRNYSFPVKIQIQTTISILNLNREIPGCWSFDMMDFGGCSIFSGNCVTRLDI